MSLEHLKLASLKAAVVLVPSYAAALLTDKMTFVVPTLAAASFFASTIGLSAEDTRRQVDEDGGGDPDDGDPDAPGGDPSPDV